MIIKSVYPIGLETIEIERDSLEIIDRFFQFHDRVYKLNGSEVSKNVFLSEDYSGISALIYTKLKFEENNDLTLVHNYSAKNELQKKSLTVANEYWVEKNKDFYIVKSN